MVKLIAIDLDGTLLNSEGKISTNNLAAIRHAEASGMKVVVATGRAQFDVKKIFAHTALNPWIIGTNGATIHQPDGKLFHAVPLDKIQVMDITEWLEKENFYYEVFGEEAIYTPNNREELIAIEIDREQRANPDTDTARLKLSASIQFSQNGFSFIDSCKDLMDKNSDFYNILAFSFDKSKLKKGRKQFERRKDLTLVSSGEHNFELEDPSASKGLALTRLMNHLGVAAEETAAIGDSYNDLSMLEIAGRGAAMGNADEAIKNACRETALTNDEDGVAHFIYSMI